MTADRCAEDETIMSEVNENDLPEVECPNCGWQGMSNELHSKTGLKFDVEFIFCPDCGEEVSDYEEDEKQAEEIEDDICGLCGEPGADKIRHPIHWPGETVPDSEYVHASCEDEECRRAHSVLSQEEREKFISLIGMGKVT